MTTKAGGQDAGHAHASDFRPPVIIVEDDAAIRGFVAHVLRARGYPVHEAATAEVALLVLATLDPANAPIVLSDKCLPGMTGLDMVEKIGDAVDDYAAVLMTAFADKEALMRSVELGVFRCLTKPFHLDELLGVVEKASEVLARRREARDEKRELATRNAELERRLREAHEEKTARQPGRLPPGLRILFVEDDALVQRAYARLFPRQEVRVTTSDAALELVDRERPDLIVCNVQVHRQLGERRPSLAARAVVVAGSEPPPVRLEAPVVRRPFAPAELEGMMLALIAS